MPTKGRDLKVSFLTDLDKFHTDDAADGLEDVSDAADRTDKALDELGRNDADQQLGIIEKGARAVGDKLGDMARDADRAFDKLAAASKAGARKVDDSMDDAKRGLDEFKDEAKSSGRESAASFGGGFDDVGDFVQETAANAFAGFGPLGAAAGTVAAIGIGIATKALEDAKERAQQAKEDIQAFFDAIVEGQGRVSDAAIENRLSDLLGDPDKYKEIKAEAEAASVSVALYARALAGDPDAVRRLQEAIDAAAEAADKHYGQALAGAITKTNDLGAAQGALVDPTTTLTTLTGEAAASQEKARGALEKVDGKLSDVAERLGAATDAYGVLKDATTDPIVVGIKVPTAADFGAVSRAIREGIGTVTVPVTLGHTTGSRYRE